MKVLVISRVPWDISNSFGNTYENLLGNNSKIEIANIYCASGKPNTKQVRRFFCISEKMILNKLFRKTETCGKEVYCTEAKTDDAMEQLKAEKHAKKRKWQILYWIRDCLWATNLWKSKELNDFLDDFKPDLIFSPLYYSIYMNDVRRYIKKYTDVPMISFVSDDVYTLKQFNISPLYWINRFIIRGKIRKTVADSQKLYVISEEQKKEYDKAFGIDCEILFKGAEFEEKEQKKYQYPIKMVYMGNLSVGRWKTIYDIGKAVKRINEEKKMMQFDVYSLTELSENIKKKFELNAVTFKGGVSGERVPEILNEYDILVHCESFKLKEKLQVRLSFSTKLVDYFREYRCIFAVGPNNIASIEYLKRNNAAAIATSVEEILPKLQELVKNPEEISLYARRAWECGKSKHELQKIKDKLCGNFEELIGEKRESNSN